MADDPAVVRAAAPWRELAAVPVAFGAAGEAEVVVSPGSRLCPPGWVGVVVLGGAAVVTAPTQETADRIRAAVAGVPAGRLGDPAVFTRAFPLGRVLGPAALAYVSAAGFRPAAGDADPDAGVERPERLPAGHPDLTGLHRAAGRADADEAGLDEITSPAFAVRVDGRIAAAAGYCRWPGRTAHLAVLTAPALRGRGLARAAASAAVRHALARDLLPQWRARVPASRRVAAALGFTELGVQLSVEPL
ncbi:GNAT family N-acetyltransferase [Kitasatospora sp. NPDC015120]|uniref:GNAT family N-acetyltransferase n=1 Tax=Kitasatospora sp. NPDC015120 TaxID=3364023 RepID=UPI0036F4643F